MVNPPLQILLVKLRPFDLYISLLLPLVWLLVYNIVHSKAHDGNVYRIFAK